MIPYHIDEWDFVIKIADDISLNLMDFKCIDAQCCNDQVNVMGFLVESQYMIKPLWLWRIDTMLWTRQ